jgi:hypothetical protein
MRGRKAKPAGAGDLAPPAGAPPAAAAPAPAPAPAPPGRRARGSGGRGLRNAATLAATVPHHLRQVVALLPATAKERYLGHAACCE